MPPRLRTCSLTPSQPIAAIPQIPRNTRHFSQTCRCEVRTTRLRRKMFQWLHGPGASFQQPREGQTNYLGALMARRQGIEEAPPEEEDEAEEGEEGEEGKKKEGEDEQIDPETGEVLKKDTRQAQGGEGRGRDQDQGRPPKINFNELRPYPLNKQFHSEPVLSEELREELWSNVVEQRKSLEVISARYNVSLERVAAVVRLKQIEKDWLAQGKQLNTAYSTAVMAMLPKTELSREKPKVHESVNDLPVHRATRQQLFIPTSESRSFTRYDAAKAFSPSLLPAEDRIPNQALLHMERLQIKAKKENMGDNDRKAAIQSWLVNRIEERREADKRAREKEERETTMVKGRRWDFRFTDVNADQVRPNGRSTAAPGWRYGMPHEDRKRGQVKIPTSVE